MRKMMKKMMIGVLAIGVSSGTALAADECALTHYQPYQCSWGVVPTPGSITVSDPTFSQVAWIQCTIIPDVDSSRFCFRACQGTAFNLDNSDLQVDFDSYQFFCTNRLNSSFGSSWTASMYASCITQGLNGPGVVLSCIGDGGDGGGVIP